MVTILLPLKEYGKNKIMESCAESLNLTSFGDEVAMFWVGGISSE